MNAPVTTLETTDIMRLLPHRYPFLLVDRIIEINGDESCIGIKNVSVNEPFFQGHFPNRPVMPGVLLLEAMAQTGGAVCALALGFTEAAGSVYFLTVDKAKFRKPVVPGDVVEFHVRKKARKRSMCWFIAEAKVRGETVAEAELGAMITKE